LTFAIIDIKWNGIVKLTFERKEKEDLAPFAL
jgi:hypothetical protein